ncbi:MAG: hypothetical protein ACHQ1D_01210 [Nitrososphaerales archaeon]
MKYCGCNNCRLNGERNLIEEFDLYCAIRDEELNAEFNAILMTGYNIGELEKLYAELEPEFSGVSRIVARILSYSMSDNTWNSYEYIQDKYGHIRKGWRNGPSILGY